MELHVASEAIIKFMANKDTDDDKNYLTSIVNEMGQELYARVLMAHSSAICGHIPFYTSMLRPAKFLMLMMALDKKYWLEVLAMMEDGNTCLTEPVAWGHVDVVNKLLAEVEPELKLQILQTTDHRGRTLETLLNNKPDTMK